MSGYTLVSCIVFDTAIYDICWPPSNFSYCQVVANRSGGGMYMKLFRDFIDGRICFYWAAEIGMQLSPQLATRQEAEEWWRAFRFSQYPGSERRCSIQDRRSNMEKRHRLAKGARAGAGRRATDVLIRVDCDLASDKIDAWKALATHESGYSD